MKQFILLAITLVLVVIAKFGEQIGVTIEDLFKYGFLSLIIYLIVQGFLGEKLDQWLGKKGE